jgi:hypothetical protein
MSVEIAPPQTPSESGSQTTQFDLGRELHRIRGVDLTGIDGIDVSVAQTVVSEVGLDMSRGSDEHHIASAPRRHHSAPEPELSWL